MGGIGRDPQSLQRSLLTPTVTADWRRRCAINSRRPSRAVISAASGVRPRKHYLAGSPSLRRTK